MFQRILILSLMTVLFTSCLKSTEDLQREKLVVQLDRQMKDSQKIIADMTVKLKDFEQKVSTVNGQIETIEHESGQSKEKNKLSQAQKILELNEKIKYLELKITNNQNNIKSLDDNIKKQKVFFKKINKSLNTITQAPKSAYKKDLSSALKNLRKNKYKKAKGLFESILLEKISNADRNKAYHGLGIISYNQKRYEDTTIYMSKIYTKWPKSSKAASSLFYIAKAFKAQKKSDEAKQLFTELISKYPKSPEAKKAKKEI
ncbi:MAG: TolA-binding protein [Thermoproteota archaeon]|jgi:TolA-binding protein